MHRLGMIFAWSLVIMFAVGFTGSMVIAVVDLWDGIASFWETPPPAPTPQSRV